MSPRNLRVPVRSFIMSFSSDWRLVRFATDIHATVRGSLRTFPRSLACHVRTMVPCRPNVPESLVNISIRPPSRPTERRANEGEFTSEEECPAGRRTPSRGRSRGFIVRGGIQRLRRAVEVTHLPHGFGVVHLLKPYDRIPFAQTSVAERLSDENRCSASDRILIRLTCEMGERIPDRWSSRRDQQLGMEIGVGDAAPRRTG
jgi:hypothetical protein